MAMAAAVGAHALDGGSTVRGWRAIASSYPEFAEHFAQLGAARQAEPGDQSEPAAPTDPSGP